MKRQTRSLSGFELLQNFFLCRQEYPIFLKRARFQPAYKPVNKNKGGYTAPIFESGFTLIADQDFIHQRLTK
jgi:hypothetical protein